MTYMNGQPGKFSREWVEGALRRVETAYKDRRTNPALSHEIIIELLRKLLERLEA
jgi:hypothetical protein